jgi:hypothetical protein
MEVNVVKNLQKTLAPLGIVLLVAGCGGGASSSDNSGDIPTASVQITSSNAPTVAGGSVSSTKSMSSTGGSMSTAVVGAMVSPNGRMPSVLEISLAEFERARSLHLPAATVAGVIPGGTYNCETGTYSYSFLDPNDNGIFDGGDTLTFTYNSCLLGSATTNGTVTFAVNTLVDPVTPTPVSPSTSSFTLTFSGYSSVITGAGSISMEGDITISASNDGTTLEASMNGASFDMASSVDGNFRMTTYSFHYSENSATGVYVMGAGVGTPMTMGGSMMGGYVTVFTPVEFSGIGYGNPSVGTMVITGEGNSSVTIQTVDTINVDLLVDSNGDGTTDDTIHTTWAEL